MHDVDAESDCRSGGAKGECYWNKYIRTLSICINGQGRAGSDVKSHFNGLGKAVDNSVGKKKRSTWYYLFANSARIDEIRSWKFRGTSAYELFQTQKSSRALRSPFGAGFRSSKRSGWPSQQVFRPVEVGGRAGEKASEVEAWRFVKGRKLPLLGDGGAR